MPLPVRRPANAIASIAVRRRRLVSGSSIRRRRHPSGRANRRHAPSRSCSARGAEASLWPSLTSSVCALSPLLAGLQWRRASALLAGVLLVALLGTRLFASGDRRAQSAHPRALARTTYAYAPAGRPVSARRPFPRRRIRPSPEPRAGRSRMRNGARARKRSMAPVALVAARPAHQSDASAPPATPAAPSASGQFAYLGQ